jgi:hypothetical protein
MGKLGWCVPCLVYSTWVRHIKAPNNPILINLTCNNDKALGESLEPTTFVLQTECGKVRSGPLLDFQVCSHERGDHSGYQYNHTHQPTHPTGP